MTSVHPYLSDEEIAEICAPLEQPAAQVRYLCSQGLIVRRKPNGRPLVARGEFERVLIGRQPAQEQNVGSGQPDRAALLRIIQGGKRGAQAQGQ